MALRRLILFVAVLMAALMVPALIPQNRPTMTLEVEGRGRIVIEMYPDKAPKTVAHIQGLVRRGFYDGQRFFRVITEPRPYLIQTGDPASRTQAMDSANMGSGGSGARVPYEDSGLPNDTGYVGLSTLPRDRDSGDSQFYILLGPSRFLDGQYTVFGRVTQGMDVVRSIQLGDRITSIR